MFVMIYFGKDSDSLTDLRYLKYMKISSYSRTIRPDNFSPAERVAYASCITGIFPIQDWNFNFNFKKVP